MPQNSLMANQLKAALNKKHEEEKKIEKQEKDVFQKKAREIREFLEKTYPKAFNREDFKPLKIGIHKDLLQLHPNLFDPPQHLKYFIKNHTGQVGYSYAMLTATHRIDLEGNQVSEIQESERAHAKKIRAEFNKMRREKFIDTLYQNHKKCFTPIFRKRQPLSDKIVEQIKDKYPKISEVLIKRTITYYTGNYSYHENLSRATHTIDINGNKAEEISEKSKEEAKKIAQELREKIHQKNTDNKNKDNKDNKNNKNNKNKDTDIKKDTSTIIKQPITKQPITKRKDQPQEKPDSEAKT